MAIPKKIKISSIIKSQSLADIYLENFDLKNEMNQGDVYKDEKNDYIIFDKKSEHVGKMISDYLYDSNNQSEFYSSELHSDLYTILKKYKKILDTSKETVSYSPSKLPSPAGHYFYDNCPTEYPATLEKKMVLTATVSMNDIKSIVSCVEEKIPDISKEYWNDESSLVFRDNNFLYIKTFT